MNNKEMEGIEYLDKSTIHVKPADGDALVYLKDFTFEYGNIEITINIFMLDQLCKVSKLKNQYFTPVEI